MASRETLEQRLADAEDAYHRLSTGTLEVTIQYENRSTTYAKADLGQLKNYIRELKADLGTASGSRRAILPRF